MWPMIAEPGLCCEECRHNIQPGRLCLSELPEEMPSGVSRSDFRNYCIGCPECWRRGLHACYVRYLEDGNSKGRTQRSLPCARCGRLIPSGDRAGMEAYYDWPEALENGEGPTGRTTTGTTAAGTVATAASINTLVRGVPSGSFAGLSDSLQQKFARAGLGGDRGSWPDPQVIYRDTIAYPIRNLGEDAIRRFTDGKDLSHRFSVSNAPELANSPDNIVGFENESLNRSRGAETMTGMEEFRLHGTNAFHTSGIVFRECLGAAATTALFAALLESPISIVENAIHYRKGRKTGEEAIKEAATAIKDRAAAGAVVGFAVKAAIALTGAAPLVVTIAPVLMPVGMTLYAYTAVKRILSALDDGLPLNRVSTYFCSQRCHTTFAYETGRSALMRWETDRTAVAASHG